MPEANRLLDEIGLTKRDDEGFRLLPDGRPLTVIVDTSNQTSEESDVLELIRDDWAKIGVRLFTKPSVRDVFRNRIFDGEQRHVGLDRAGQRSGHRGFEPGGTGAGIAAEPANGRPGASIGKPAANPAKRPTCPRPRS